MSVQHDFRGVNTAVLTPINEDLSPNVGRMATYAKWLLANGTDGLAVLGTTGEANSFSLDERISIMEGLESNGIDPNIMMPGTGACALPDAVAATSAAVSLGCSGVLILPPFYYKSPSDDGLFAYFSELVQRIGSNDLRIYLYHFPQMSAVPISVYLIERLLKEYPNTIAGMKDSSGDLENMVTVAERFPGFSVFAGSEACFLPLLRRGGAGCITACSNVTSSLAQRVYSAFADGAEDEIANRKLCAVRAAVEKYPLAAALKTIISEYFGDKDWLHLRPPFRALQELQKRELFRNLRDAELNISLPA